MPVTIYQAVAVVGFVVYMAVSAGANNYTVGWLGKKEEEEG